MGSWTCMKEWVRNKGTFFKPLKGIYSNVRMLFLLNPHIIHSQVVGSNSHFNYTVRIREVSCWSKSDSKPKENKSFPTFLYSYFPLIIIFHCYVVSIGYANAGMLSFTLHKKCPENWALLNQILKRRNSRMGDMVEVRISAVWIFQNIYYVFKNNKYF